MTRKKLCHPTKVKRKKTGRGVKYSIPLFFDEEQYEWVELAAEAFTSGCVCDLVGNLFWEEFKRLSEEILKEAKEKSVEVS